LKEDDDDDDDDDDIFGFLQRDLCRRKPWRLIYKFHLLEGYTSIYFLNTQITVVLTLIERI